MGGRNSGNRWRSKATTCESYLRIDLRYLKKRNMLTSGNRFSLSWNRGGEPSGNIQFMAYENHILLDFKSRNYGEEEWQNIQQHVLFNNTRMNFGGQRRWFLCPRCNRRCLILYGGSRFYCRKCYRLSYETQSEAPWQRQMTRAQKIRKRLGDDGCFDDPFPPKPKGMHWKTYHKLEQFDDKAQKAWNYMALQFMAKL